MPVWPNRQCNLIGTILNSVFFLPQIQWLSLLTEPQMVRKIDQYSLLTKPLSPVSISHCFSHLHKPLLQCILFVSKQNSGNLYLFTHFQPYFIFYSTILIRCAARIPWHQSVTNIQLCQQVAVYNYCWGVVYCINNGLLYAFGTEDPLRDRYHLSSLLLTFN